MLKLYNECGFEWVIAPSWETSTVCNCRKSRWPQKCPYGLQHVEQIIIFLWECRHHHSSWCVFLKCATSILTVFLAVWKSKRMKDCSVHCGQKHVVVKTVLIYLILVGLKAIQIPTVSVSKLHLTLIISHKKNHWISDVFESIAYQCFNCRKNFPLGSSCGVGKLIRTELQITCDYKLKWPYAKDRNEITGWG